MNKNIVPPMTDALSRHWEQPKTENILIDDNHAAMSMSDFKMLADYSCSQPSGVYVGKMWKAKYKRKGIESWCLCWFGADEMEGYCSNNYREILIIE